MGTISKFEDINSWQEARHLNLKLGVIIDSKRLQNNYRLINQIEGSAGSIMDNIAEGFERNGNKEFLQFLYIAKGSCGELRSQLYRAFDRNYIDEREFGELSEQATKISRLLQKLASYLHETRYVGPKYTARELKENVVLQGKAQNLER